MIKITNMPYLSIDIEQSPDQQYIMAIYAVVSDNNWKELDKLQMYGYFEGEKYSSISANEKDKREKMMLGMFRESIKKWEHDANQNNDELVKFCLGDEYDILMQK